jgi:hypothetical protein
MSAKTKFAALLALALFTATALYCLWLWQPQRQALKHQQTLLTAAGKRNWNKVSSLIAENYSDRWGFSKSVALRESSEILRQFFFLEIKGETLATESADDSAVILQRITLDGKGTALAEMAKQEVNSRREPFRFEWKRQSWKPWDWQLTRVDHPQLRVRQPIF